MQVLILLVSIIPDILVIVGGIISGLWLIFTGNWMPLIYGLLSLIFSVKIISLAILPSMFIGMQSIKLIDDNKFYLGILLGAISIIFTQTMVMIWCIGNIYFYKNILSESLVIPALLWAYTISIFPVSWLSNFDARAGNYQSTEILLIFQTACILSILSIYFLNFSVLKVVFLFISLMGIYTLYKTFFLCKLHENENGFENK